MSVNNLIKTLSKFDKSSEEYAAIMKTLRNEIRSIAKNNDIDALPNKLQNEITFREFLYEIGFKNESEVDNITRNIFKELLEVDDEATKAYKRHDIILLLGPSGSGKSHEAKRVHELMAPGKPFIEINCATLDPNLAASELFGHQKGAFTGADTTTDGAFVDAKDGTLFLDEIEDLPLNLQGKLNTVLETGTVRRVGSSKSTPIECKIIAASNKDIKEMVTAREFRNDLYTRLTSGEIITMEPIHERPNDLIRVINDTIQRLSDENNVEITINKKAISLLSKIQFGGNIRDLIATVRRAFYNALDDNESIITVDHIKHESTGEIGILDALKQKFDYDPETMEYLARSIAQLTTDPSQVDTIIEQFPFEKVYLDRIENVYKEMGGQKDIKKWLMKSGLDYFRSFHDDPYDLSTEAIKKALIEMSRDQGYMSSDLIENVDNIIVESKDNMELSVPTTEMAMDDIDSDIIDSVSALPILTADEDIVGIMRNM
jgi:transcriptional regulator with PAS, ATPase and Fis domain